ncbi:MAG TPA: TSUP family transporter [Candidatus Pseudomonas excrementavium]|uniref:TSUP family transporter n=1 Tax=Halopseudomonas bauzanensis TaxID=653930 RepID=UPI001C3A4355|nr:TSUP family transporter [Halopseudomonas bauzanensis]HIZ50109.1 TSUP family transporter [Candidatus Pseudomonas excrementavium]
METTSLVIVVLAVALGSYLQACTGFALGITVLAVTVLSGAAPIELMATVISVVALPGIAIALRHHWRHIDRVCFLRSLFGLIPGTLLGLWLLGTLEQEYTFIVQALLGALIIAGGVALFIRPAPRPARSSSGSFAVMGMFGGLLGGLFSVPGPPLIYHYYRQPLSVMSIRTSLLALSGVMSLSRLLMQAQQGQLDSEVMLLSISCIPVAALATWFYLRFPLKLSDLAMRRGAFALFIAMGLSIALMAVLVRPTTERQPQAASGTQAQMSSITLQADHSLP